MLPSYLSDISPAPSPVPTRKSKQRSHTTVSFSETSALNDSSSSRNTQNQSSFLIRIIRFVMRYLWQLFGFLPIFNYMYSYRKEDSDLTECESEKEEKCEPDKVITLDFLQSKSESKTEEETTSNPSAEFEINLSNQATRTTKSIKCLNMQIFCLRRLLKYSPKTLVVFSILSICYGIFLVAQGMFVYLNINHDKSTRSKLDMHSINSVNGIWLIFLAYLCNRENMINRRIFSKDMLLVLLTSVSTISITLLSSINLLFIETNHTVTMACIFINLILDYICILIFLFKNLTIELFESHLDKLVLERECKRYEERNFKRHEDPSDSEEETVL